LDQRGLGIQEVWAPSPFGPCVALIVVTLDTPTLRDALAPVAGRYELFPLFTPIG
jgi:hypothetical protein